MTKLEQALFNAYNGIVEPFLFHPTSAIQILKQVSESLNLGLPFPPHKKWLPKFYDIITILPFRVSKASFLFLIIVPLLSHPSVFTLYEVNSLPVPTNDSLVLQIKPDASYLAVSRDKRSFLVSKNLNHCKRSQNSYFCNVDTPLLSKATNDCLVFQRKEHLQFCNTVM